MTKYPLMLTMSLSGLNLEAQTPVITSEKLHRIDSLAEQLTRTQQIAGASILLFYNLSIFLLLLQQQLLRGIKKMSIN